MGKKVHIVGAGLAGLTAAVNCAAEGHEVIVLEKYKKIGGIPYTHPAMDATPMEPEKLSKFAGIKIDQPAVKPATRFHFFVYGKAIPMSVDAWNLHIVERGGRSSSLESSLINQAEDMGVNIEYGWELKSDSDLAELPSDSIIATGLEIEPYDLLNIPYERVYGYIGRGKEPREGICGAGFSSYTREYQYYGASNGFAFGLCFDSKPIYSSVRDRWAEELERLEGVRFETFVEHEGAVGRKNIDNPRLFAGNKIVAGAVAGFNEPFALFGVHGAIVSGKIASIAISDKATAYELFKKYTYFYKITWTYRQLFKLQPNWFRKALLRIGIGAQSKNETFQKAALNQALKIVAGYRRV